MSDPRIAQAVSEALAAAAASPSISLQHQDVEATTAAVTTALAPTLDYLANREPWYRSPVTMGSLVAVGAGLAGIAGYTVTAEDQRQIVDSVVALTDLATAAAAVLGGLVALWGRWRARRPLGR